jgi:hypothetical protein
LDLILCLRADEIRPSRMNPAQKSPNYSATKRPRISSRRPGQYQSVGRCRNAGPASVWQTCVWVTTSFEQISNRESISGFASRACSARPTFGLGECNAAPLHNIYATTPTDSISVRAPGHCSREQPCRGALPGLIEFEISQQETQRSQWQEN